jgi:acyl carrier protein
MTKDEAVRGVIKVIKDNIPDMFGNDLNENTVLNEHGNVDSMGFILIVTKLEGMYNVHIPDEEWLHMTTIGDLAEAIIRYQPEGK